MKKIISTAIAVSLLFISGCTSRIGDFTVVSTSNINLNNGKFVTGERIKGKDSVPIVIVPFGSPDMETAVENAVFTNKNNCVVGLENVTLSYEYLSLILFGYRSYNVEGNAIYDTTKPNCEKYLTTMQNSKAS